MAFHAKKRLGKLAKDLLWFFTAAGTYILVAYSGLQLTTVNPQVSPVWPATGVAICLYYLWGRPAALGIFFGAFFVNLQTGLSVNSCFLIGLGNTGEVLIGISLFKFLMVSKIDYGRHKKVIFGMAAVVIATAFSATVGSLALYLDGIIDGSTFLQNWSTWWMGDLIGALFFIPLAYGTSIQRLSLFDSKKRQYVVFVCALWLLLSLSYWIFFTSLGSAYLFSIYIVLLIAARYLNTIWVFLFSLFIGFCATYATYQGQGPFAENILNENMMHLQLFLLGLGITALGLGSLSEAGLRRWPATTLLFSWLISGLTFFSFFKSSHETDRRHFTDEARSAQKAIYQTFNDYFGLLDSGAALFNTSDYVSKEMWKTYVNQIMSNKKFTGVKAIGVAFGSRTNKTEDFIKENQLRPIDVKNLVVKEIPFIGRSTRVERPELHFIVTYLAPDTNASTVVGIDFSTEKFRYDAAVQARNSGTITATNIVHLSSELNPRPAFNLLVPFYKKNAQLQTLEQRKAAFRGLVYTPIIIEPFILSALGHHAKEMHLTLEFKTAKGDVVTSFTSPDRPIDAENKIVNQTMLAGQDVTMTWRKSEKFKSSSNLVFSLISFFGSIISLLIAIMLSTLQSLAWTAQEIAERKTKEIIERNKIWRLLTETAPVGIFLMDPTGRSTYVNSTFTAMTDLSSEKLIGIDWKHFAHADDKDLVDEKWQELLRVEKFNCNFRIINEEKDIIFVWGQIVPMRTEKNQINGYLGVFQDVTDAVQKNNSLVASSRMSSLGEMASGVAHEINNPLSIIIGKAEILILMLGKGNFDADKFKKYSRQISDTAQRIAKIIRGLRSFSRETSNVPFEICALADIIQETLVLCRERFLCHNVDLRLFAKQYEDLVCWGRPEQLAQVLLNLLNNAFDAAILSENKWVEVNIMAENKKIKIVVTDSGAGIPENLTEKIFEPFYTTKEIGKGTGLGLSISKGIMHNHRGALYVDRESTYTQFVVEIPEHTPYDDGAKDNS